MDARIRRRTAHAVGLALATALVAGMAGAPAAAAGAPTVSVIIDGAARDAAAAVERLGGTVDSRLAVVDGLTATVPEGAVAALEAVPGVRSVTPDSTLQSLGVLWGDDTTNQGLLSSLLFGSWRADGDKNSAY